MGTVNACYRQLLTFILTGLNGKNFLLFTDLPKLASAIQQKHMKMDIEIKRTAKTLDAGLVAYFSGSCPEKPLPVRCQ
jgi:hypothetical protein